MDDEMDEIPEGFTEEDRCPSCGKFKFGPTICEGCIEAPLHSEIRRLKGRLEGAEAALKEWEIRFDLYDEAARRATERWRAENPEERELVMPDHAKLCQWLMAKWRQTEKELEDELDLTEEIVLTMDGYHDTDSRERLVELVDHLFGVLKKHGAIE